MSQPAKPYAERALSFDSQGQQLIGILAQAQGGPEADTAVVIIVGGPQYRAGSHRQFTLLARALASQGWPVLRFDYRGMGDSEGEALPHFERCEADVEAAISATLAEARGVRRVVLWGLCDGASAAMLYQQRRRDSRVAGLCLTNPWVRSAEGLARTQVRHYYTRRLMQPQFWRKLIAGGVGWKALSGLGSALATIARSRAAARPAAAAAGTARPSGDFRQAMAACAAGFTGPVLLTLSGDDYTAKEFIDLALPQAPWQQLLRSARCQRLDLPQADHTLSDPADEARLIATTLQWLAQQWPQDRRAAATPHA